MSRTADQVFQSEPDCRNYALSLSERCTRVCSHRCGSNALPLKAPYRRALPVKRAKSPSARVSDPIGYVRVSAGLLQKKTVENSASETTDEELQAIIRRALKGGYLADDEADEPAPAAVH